MPIGNNFERLIVNILLADIETMGVQPILPTQPPGFPQVTEYILYVP